MRGRGRTRVITIVIGIGHAERTPPVWAFAPADLAAALGSLRAARGWSTREVARRAGISQPYVVALERAARPGGASSRAPTPTIDVVARLAAAFSISPTALIDAALRPTGRHVLYVADGDASPLTALAGDAGGSDGDDRVDAWIWVGDGAPPPSTDPEAAARRMRLRRELTPTFDHDAVARALATELRSIPADLRPAHVGLVFGDTSRVLDGLAEPGSLLDAEHTWARTVSTAAWSAGVHASRNVCVYELDSLRRLDDPAAACLDLLRSHDDVWFDAGRRARRGRPAARSLLHAVRPDGVPAHRWRTEVAQLLAQEARIA